MKKVYLSNGEEAEVLAEYKDGNKTEYVVKVAIAESGYEDESEPIYENRIVSKIYENFEDVPLYSVKTELENKIEELDKSIKELTEQKTKLTKELKSVYNPQYTIGTPIYFTSYGNKVEELRIIKIVFTEQEDKSFYTYHCNKEYRSFEEISDGTKIDGYFLTKEEAEKARQNYLENKKAEERKRIEDEYKRAKEDYDKMFSKN